MRDGSASLFGLSAQSIARRIRAAAAAAGLGSGFSGHSGRVGMAHGRGRRADARDHGTGALEDGKNGRGLYARRRRDPRRSGWRDGLDRFRTTRSASQAKSGDLLNAKRSGPEPEGQQHGSGQPSGRLSSRRDSSSREMTIAKRHR